MKKRLVAVVGVVAIAFLSYFAFTAVDSKTSVATAAKKMYSATAYVAGHGGHFAKIDVAIDPNNADSPLQVKGLDRFVVGDAKNYAMHDVRIDSNDSNITFWSTYIPDKDGNMHVGKSDLKSGDKLKDVVIAQDDRSTKKPPLYCASGQSKNSYMPVFMGVEGFVDVFDKGSLDHKHRVFISDLGYAKGTYQFTHGTNSPDMKTFILTMNQVKDGKMTGDVDFVMVDLAALENGKFKQLAKTTLKGEAGKTITFRMYFTRDGKYIMQSAADRLWVLDAKTLKLVDEKMIPDGGQLHDAIPTPDGKYAVMTTRNLEAAPGTEGKEVTGGFISLYDADAKKIVGKASSICIACHKQFGLGKAAILCGIDANWKK